MFKLTGRGAGQPGGSGHALGPSRYPTSDTIPPRCKLALDQSFRWAVVNFWGAEPARTIVANMVGTNRHHPRFFVNGPFTGMALIEEGVEPMQAADDLALDVVLYDQQLCSSPTTAVFIGSYEKAKEFLRVAGERLDETGKEFPLPLDQDRLFILQGARRFVQTDRRHRALLQGPGEPLDPGPVQGKAAPWETWPRSSRLSTCSPAGASWK